MGLQVVLGAKGVIGQAVIKELQKRGLPVRAVGRSVSMPNVESVKADMLIEGEVIKATMGASHVYLCVGLPYNAKVWKEQWPVVMENTIAACEKNGARLAFFDNIYMYGPAPLAVPFDETHPQNPQTKKGQVRKQIADRLLNAHKAGKIKALIGRSADFYGPGATNSALYASFLERMLQGKAPQLLGKPGIRHTYGFTGDLGRALVALALEEDTYGEAWHLPVGASVTVEEINALYNKILGANLAPSFMPRAMLPLVGLFVPIVNDLREMLYQFDNEYSMSFDKFKKRFPTFTQTDLETGLREMVKSFQK